MGRLAGILVFNAMALAAQTPAPLGRLVDVGGYRVHLYCTGSGSPTVFIAGAGFSFDWTLVQSEAGRFTTICTYDVPGTAWSDPGLTGPTAPSRSRLGTGCRERAAEMHRVVAAANLQRPIVLAGLSLGACVARLYAALYPADVAGLILIDHAFQPDRPPDSTGSPAVVEKTPIEVTVEDISHFDRLPENVRALHRWAMSLHPKLPGWDAAEDCLAELKRAAPGPYPLGNLPLTVISTGNEARGYARLQSQLMALSHNSTQRVAERSFHAVEIDQPDVIVDAIRQMVDGIRLRM